MASDRVGREEGGKRQREEGRGREETGRVEEEEKVTGARHWEGRGCGTWVCTCVCTCVWGVGDVLAGLAGLVGLVGLVGLCVECAWVGYEIRPDQRTRVGGAQCKNRIYCEYCCHDGRWLMVNGRRRLSTGEGREGRGERGM